MSTPMNFYSFTLIETLPLQHAAAGQVKAEKTDKSKEHQGTEKKQHTVIKSKLVAPNDQ